MRRTVTPLLLLGLIATLAAARGLPRPPPEVGPGAGPGASNVLPEDPVDFDRDLLPLMGPKCLGCHSGPAPKGRLDLLSRENALRGGASDEAALVPGDPEQSRLLAVVDGSDGELRMPPAGPGLSPDEIALLRRWVAEGAPWSKSAEALGGQPWHWAYRGPRAVPPPADSASEPSAGPRDSRGNPIDAFVEAGVRRAGLVARAQAPRTTLARRLSLAILGLPPDPAEVDAWVADTAPDALERYVDRLLASPRYGERMARPWLDLARYADTHGYEKDDRRSMWPWRDWVIESFNANRPYDRFALEQLAGDLLPDATLDTRIATGFHRNTMINEEGGTDPEEFRVEAVHDRVHTTASAFLGTTLSCARCHDHKFDPFTIEDYYSFFAFFDADRADATVLSPSEQRASGAQVRVAPREERESFARAVERRDEALAEIERPDPALDLAQQAWEERLRSGPDPWTVLAPAEMECESGASLERQPDGSILVGGAAAESDTYRFTILLPGAGARALRLEVLPVEQGEKRAVGRAEHGNFVLSEFGAVCVAADRKSGGPVSFQRAFADHEQHTGGENWPAAHAVDGKPKTGWAVGGATERAHSLVLECAEPFAAAAGATLRITLAQRYGGGHTIARLRLSVAQEHDSALLAPLAQDTALALEKAALLRSAEEQRRVAEHYRAHAPSLAAARARLAAAESDLARISTATTLVMERAASPRTTRVHRKGNFLDQGAEVQPELPRVFGPLPEGLPRDRLGLARWIASKENPLFARVFVNHLWALDFGRGLVPTPEDFGTQGDPPSHPELLDFLAVRFQESGFDVKALQKLIVTSRTFLQDSRLDEEALERDPDNVWLARGPRYRLEAEALRDNALAAAGLLDSRVGGPSVFPPQPPGIWTMIYSSDQWVESTGADRYRRGLYTFARRTAPYPTSALFDAPSREISCPRRSRTNTPLQALALLNDPQFVEAAVALGRRMQREPGAGSAGGAAGSTGDSVAEREAHDREALARGFRYCVARAPEPRELELTLELLRQELARFAADPAAARALTAQGHGMAAPDEDPARTAAFTVVANVLLNLDETSSLE
ncbi:MAG: DUF1553 domain-containing protein [Planctomycetes bacterium]|nr:DUF1553 domain-containing protein [Planctomycetota bacterium]